MTIRWRMAFAVALQTALLLLIVAAILYLALQQFLVAGQERRLDNAISLLDLRRDLDRNAQDIGGLTVGSEFPTGVQVRVLTGTQVVSKTANFPNVPTDLPLGYTRVDGHQVLTRQVMADNRLVLLQVASDLGSVSQPLRAYLRALLVTLPVMMLFAAVAAAITAGRLLKPIAALQRAASSIGASGDLLQPVPGASGRDELGRLATTLEQAFRRLNAVMERESEFTRAAAHDLRTPLTALQARIQGALARPRTEPQYRDTLAELGRDVSRLSRLTEHLLLLARDDAAFHATPTDLRRLAGEAVDRVRSRSPGVSVDFQAGAMPTVLGDALLLSHVIDNLLENAVRHGRGAPVRVSVAAHEEDAELVVADDGPGVSEETRARLGERFFRGDAARSGDGSGLGLAIVAHVVALHGGSWAVESAPGEGFRVSVWLPLAKGT
jgi:signal transduction histidine kinase